MIGSDYPVIESDDFGCRKCSGITSSLDLKSKSESLRIVDCRLLMMMMMLIERSEYDDDVAQRIVVDDDDDVKVLLMMMLLIEED